MDLNDLMEVVEIIAYIPRFLGMLALGLGAGWLLLHLLGGQDSWQVKAVGLVCFFGLVGSTIYFTLVGAPGALGGFTLGAGAALLFWGLRGTVKKED